MTSYEEQLEVLETIARETVDKNKAAPVIINKNDKLYLKCPMATAPYDATCLQVNALRMEEILSQPKREQLNNLCQQLRNQTDTMLKDYKRRASPGDIEVEDVIYKPVYGPGIVTEPVVSYLIQEVNDLKGELEKLKTNRW
tara:strand:- start:222 stop:644 length:423 start_codon:yes stop_codon:yes gene_type:complete